MMVNLMRIFDKPRHNDCGDRRLLHKLKVASLVPLRHSLESFLSTSKLMACVYRSFATLEQTV
jgi:hypothetical protein